MHQGQHCIINTVGIELWPFLFFGFISPPLNNHGVKRERVKMRGHAGSAAWCWGPITAAPKVPAETGRVNAETAKAQAVKSKAKRARDS